MNLDFGDIEDVKYEVEIVGIYEAEPFIDYSEDELLEKAWDIRAACLDKERVLRMKSKVDQEKRELARLKKEYPDE